ncbi:DUF397 domain-containing protein [Actinomadura fibrosa]|uniref:DUF397 domain-containing protein n=1 Tax=Actinomadura fibrosa TaxID=111802 RepID=A0ABW2XIA9_9ACTN|nr:DUF397 domain-containing protein [Actinomadura fibrosa]
MSFDATPSSPWRRSRRCGASNGCVEIARTGGGMVCVRDGDGVDEGAGDRLVFGPEEWRRFTEEARSGRFDRA